jgi:hypothetical protein
MLAPPEVADRELPETGRVVLPAPLVPPEAGARRGALNGSLSADALCAAVPLVLVSEFDEEFARMLDRLLRASGRTVVRAPDRRATWKTLYEVSPDLVVLPAAAHAAEVLDYVRHLRDAGDNTAAIVVGRAGEHGGGAQLRVDTCGSDFLQSRLRCASRRQLSLKRAPRSPSTDRRRESFCSFYRRGQPASLHWSCGNRLTRMDMLGSEVSSTSRRRARQLSWPWHLLPSTGSDARTATSLRARQAMTTSAHPGWGSLDSGSGDPAKDSVNNVLADKYLGEMKSLLDFVHAVPERVVPGIGKVKWIEVDRPPLVKRPQ